MHGRILVNIKKFSKAIFFAENLWVADSVSVFFCLQQQVLNNF